jgi:hypothetical protein
MRMLPTKPDERGIALALVLFALVITAALITGVFVVARVEQRMGDTSVAAAQAMAAAEAGLETTVGNWDPADNSLAVNSTHTLPAAAAGPYTSYSASILRLNPTLFLVTSDGQTRAASGAVLTRRQVGMLTRLISPLIRMNAAITTRVGITITGSSQVSGTDSVPPQWGATCPPPGAPAPGIRDSSGNVTTSGSCHGGSCITGVPQVLTDATVTTSSFTDFGSTSFSDLTAMANLTVSGTINGLGPVVAAGPPPTCTTSMVSNWGDPLNPLSPCFSYFPIVYAPGDLTVDGGVGQGILLVGGNLTLTGGVEFYGPVIVQGAVLSTGTGGHILGGLMANNASLDVTSITGNSVVGFSRCAINRALNAASRVRPLAERSWAQLY